MIIIVVSIILLSLLEIILIRGLSGQKNMVGVYIASEDIPRNSEITEKMISIQNFPSDAIPLLGVRDSKELLGKFAIVDFAKGELILNRRLVNDANGKLSSSGKVEISIMPNPEDALGWQISRGEFIDLLCYKNDRLKFEFDEFRNIKILDIVDNSFKSILSSDKDRKPKFLLLEVFPEQAKKLLKWKVNGKISLVRREK